MDKQLKTIYSKIDQTFEREFFYDGSEITIKRIENEVRVFKERHPDYVMTLLGDLGKSFPEAKIENWTQFFNYDRCMRFLIEVNEELRFIAQVSIFNYFSIYQHPMKLADSRYNYGDLVFINKDETELCNQIYECANGNSGDFTWLQSDILNEVIKDFSILADDKKFCNEIKIADALFTEHYI